MERFHLKTDNQQSVVGNKLRLQDYFFLCINHWPWFIISLLIAMGGAVLHLKKTPKVYTRTASILIKPNDGGSGSERQLKELGIMQSPSNVTNEILSLQTTPIAKEIVNLLNLEVNYLHEGTFHDEVIYGIHKPVTILFEDLNDNETAFLYVTLNADSSLVLSDMRRNNEVFDDNVTMKLGETKQTPIGGITVLPSPYYRHGMTDRIKVSRSTVDAVAGSVKGRISVRLRNNNSTILDISYTDVSIPRAEDVLNALITVYNENWVKDRNQITISTNDFIKERLAVIEQELGHVEQNISNYKSEHLVPDIQQVGSMAISQASAAEQESNALSNQIYMVRYIRSYLLDGRHENQLLPSNSGIGSSTIGGQIEEYNKILLQRNNHLANSSLQNPLVMDLDQHLATLRRSIIQSLDNELAILTTQQKNIRADYNQAIAKIASNPQQAKYLLSVERQQKVKESLYLFLLQKREENELSQAFTAYNTRLIEPPHGSMAPTAPVENTILLYAFCLGLAFPAFIVIGKEVLNTSIRNRKDLEIINVPFVGEIPLSQAGQKGFHLFNRNKAKETRKILITDKGRNLMNEAFRVVRTNLEFILGFNDNHHRIIMQTSINPGSGKTFITANLAVAMGIKNKKVLAVDLDLRKATLSEYVKSPHRGISNYLSGQEDDYKKLIVSQNGIDFLPCGTLPPNPSELLFSPRFRQMMEELREVYDYVFIDCPPVEVVADAAIISHYADLTLFIIRAKMLDRSFLADIERWYNEKKYKNLSVILNATETLSGYYGYHKYGYYYGKNYGTSNS